MNGFYLYYDHTLHTYIAKDGVNIIAKDANIYTLIEKIEEYFAAKEQQNKT